MRKIDFPVIRLFICRNDLCFRSFCSIFYPTIFVTLTPIITSMIKNDNLCCSGLITLSNNLLYKLRICIPRKFRNFIPSDIRFNNNFIPGFYKFTHPSHFGNCFPKHHLRFSSHNGNKIISSTGFHILATLSKNIHCVTKFKCRSQTGQSDCS